ncbi:hypothetical protein CDD82_1480 [Ophiocordyceps australis]|uniref:Uncharacterized protein n=1 Tax=Ophiocordyceps australis TaxID=1399860 RepID=A0A2C5YCP6_9HYPO|nr:hypothetical protein CDD82_1480 [Ophiocordyceps australis]
MKSTTVILLSSSAAALSIPSKRDLSREQLWDVIGSVMATTGVDTTWAAETFAKDCVPQDPAVRKAIDNEDLQVFIQEDKDRAIEAVKAATASCFTSRIPDTDEGLCFGLDDQCPSRLALCKEKHANAYTDAGYNKWLRGLVMRRCLRDETAPTPAAAPPPPPPATSTSAAPATSSSAAPPPPPPAAPSAAAPPSPPPAAPSAAPPAAQDQSIETLCNATNNAADCMAQARRCAARFSRDAKASSVFECAQCIMQNGPDKCEQFGERVNSPPKN